MRMQNQDFKNFVRKWLFLLPEYNIVSQTGMDALSNIYNRMYNKKLKNNIISAIATGKRKEKH